MKNLFVSLVALIGTAVTIAGAQSTTNQVKVLLTTGDKSKLLSLEPML